MNDITLLTLHYEFWFSFGEGTVDVWPKTLGKDEGLYSLILLTLVGSVQVLDCENSAYIGPIHWLAMHGLNSLLLSEVELEREAVRLSFLRTMPHRRYPRARGFISRFHRSTPIPVLGFRRIPHSEYKSRCSLSQAFLWTSRTARSLPLMKKPVERDASSAILPPTPCYILLDA